MYKYSRYGDSIRPEQWLESVVVDHGEETAVRLRRLE